MKKETAYSRKLKDPRWQKKRLEILNRDEFACKKCYDDKSTLHVHHRNYIPNIEPWDYPSGELVTLCESCHENESEFLPEATNDLTRIARSVLFSSEIHLLAELILNMPFVHCEDVQMTALHWYLRDRDNLKKIVDEYFIYLKEKRKIK